MLQYRSTYINDTPIIHEESNEAELGQKLRLVTVALLGKDGNQSKLEFLVGDPNSVWPSKKCIGANSSTYIAVNSFFRLHSY